jgi:hypothetical protein
MRFEWHLCKALTSQEEQCQLQALRLSMMSLSGADPVTYHPLVSKCVDKNGRVRTWHQFQHAVCGRLGYC